MSDDYWTKNGEFNSVFLPMNDSKCVNRLQSLTHIEPQLQKYSTDLSLIYTQGPYIKCSRTLPSVLSHT